MNVATGIEFLGSELEVPLKIFMFAIGLLRAH